MRARPGPSESLVVGAYRILLLCFPRKVRREFGKEMELLFTDLYRAERKRRGSPGALSIILRAFSEVPVRGWAAHREEWRWVRGERERDGRSHKRPLSGGPSGIRPEFGGLFHDLGYVLRRLARSPGLTLVAVLSLAIGMGANTAVFSVVNTTLISGRAYEEPAELVYVFTTVETHNSYANSSYQDLLELRALDDVFADVGAFSGHLSRTQESGETQPVHVEGVTDNVFRMLGLEAAMGRTFLPEPDDPPGARAVAILNWGYWQRRYGGDPSVLGRAVEIAGRPFTIVGVTPERFKSLLAPGVRSDLLIPMTMMEPLPEEVAREVYTDPRTWGMKIMGRLRPGVSLEEAQSRVNSLSGQLQAAHPELYSAQFFTVLPISDVAVQPEVDDALVYVGAMLMVVVGLVLLLACTNLVTFLLARGVDRRKEIAIRLALGVRRRRLVTEILIETVFLTFLGAGAGLLLAHWSLGLLAVMLPSTSISVMVDYGLITLDSGLDLGVLLFTFGLATLAAVLVGLLPALQSANRDVVSTLRDEGAPSGEWRHSLQGRLMAVQVAISMVLLVSGGLFLRSLQVAQEIDPGFTTREAGMVWVDLQASGIPPIEWHSVTKGLIDQARSLPGIEAMGTSTSVPLTMGSWSAPFKIPGVEPGHGHDSHFVIFSSINPAFFDVMGIPLVAGRGITEFDRKESEAVVVVNETAARWAWPGEDPLGKKIVAVGSGSSHRVVGVAGDVMPEILDDESGSHFYFSYAQLPTANVRLVARGRPASAEIAAALRMAVQAVDPDLVIIAETTLDEQLSVVLLPARLATGLLGVFGFLALGLACVGIYATVSTAVSRRTREVVIRISLGADAKDVIGMVVRGAMETVFAGAAFGLAATLGFSHLLERFLFGVDHYDLITLTSVPILLCAVALIAAFLPARRAARVDPARALHYE